MGKFRIKLNLFDAIIILLALAVGAGILYLKGRPAASASPSAPAATTQYVVRLKEVLPGTIDLMQPGDVLQEVTKNTALGTLVSATAMPATDSIVNEETHNYVTAEIPGKEDIDLVIEATVAYTQEAVIVGGNFEARVGDEIFVRGPGYLGAGEVYAIERGQ